MRETNRAIWLGNSRDIITAYHGYIVGPLKSYCDMAQTTECIKEVDLVGVTLPIGLWTAVMKPRVLCFGRRQQMYGSDHIWTTGRGHKLVPRTPLYGLFNSKWDHHLQNEYIMLY